MEKKRNFLKIIAIILIIGIVGVIGYFIYDKSDFSNPSYLIVLNASGGICDVDEIEVKKKDNQTLPTPTKEGYEFLGWYYGDTKWTDTSKIKKDITLVAKWKVLMFDITFIVDGYSTIISSSYGSYPEYGSTPAKPSTALYEYEFIGWQPALEIVKEDATYTAVFSESEIKYTVTYNSAGGECSESSVDVSPNETITLPSVTREGYEFLGWYNGETKWTNTTEVTADVELTAKWSILQFDVTFIVDGNQSTKTYDWGTYPSFGSIPTKPATNYATYEFTRWEPALEAVKANATYTAVFTENVITYAVSATANYPQACTITGSGNFTYGSSTDVEISNVNTGFEFDGWYNGGTLYSKDLKLEFDNISEDITLVAQFSLITAYITYSDGVDDKELNNPNPTEYTVLDGTINLQNLTREGYEMLGWYSSGTRVSSIDCSQLNSYTLSAFWKILTYTISYDLDGGTVSTENPTTYTIENVEILVTNPTKPDFEFVGWIGTGLTSPTLELKIPTGSIGNREYKAVWRTLLNTVSFVVDETPLAKNTLYIDYYTALTAPAVDVEDYNMLGYEIDGWYTDSACTSKYTFGSSINSDLTLYGTWNYFMGEGFYSSLSKFKTANTSTAININSFEELVAYIEYVTFYDITSRNLIKLTYKTLTTSQALFNEYSSAVDESSYPRTSILSYSTQGVTSTGSIYISTSRASIECIYVADPSKNYVCEQLESANFVNKASSRDFDFDDFAINKIKKTLKVETSNQLVYALENGLYPECVAGSSAESIYNKARAVLTNICDDTMTYIEKTRAIYEWLIMNVQYDNYAVYSSKVINNWWSYDAWYAEGVFNNGVAVCDGIAKAFLILAKIEGIPAIRINSTDHAWNKVYIGGEWYGMDSTHGNIVVNNTYEVLSYTSFMFTDDYKESEGDYSINYADVVADDIFDYYDYVDYDPSDAEIDLFIESLDDLKELLECFDNVSWSSDYFTIEIAVSGSFTDFEDVASSAFDIVSYDLELTSSGLSDSSGNDIYILYVA